jgi:hypothetical protein
MSDEDRNTTARELQETMNLGPEVEDNENGSNGDFDHDEENCLLKMLTVWRKKTVAS